MANKQLKKIGLDPGFSSVEAAEIRDGQMDTVVLPSVVGLAAP